MRIIGLMLLAYSLPTLFFVYYILTRYLLHPLSKGLLNNLCCKTVEQLPIYIHYVGGSLLLILGIIQLMRMVIKPKSKWFDILHRIIGVIYINAILATCFGGFIFIGFNGTVGGLWMDGCFAMYGILLMIYASMTVYRIFGPNHKYWAIRLYLLSTGSYFYRVLYFARHLFTSSHVTFKEPLDYIFDVAFFLIPMILAEVIIIVYLRCKSQRSDYN